MLIHPIIKNLSDDEVSSFIKFLYAAPSSEDLHRIMNSSFLLRDSFLSALSFASKHSIITYDFKNELNLKHLNDLEFSSCSRLIAESQQIVRYSVRGRLFPILGGRRYIYGCKGTLLHYKSLDLYVMIVGIGALFDTTPTYMSECRKILSCYYYFTEDIVCKNTGKMYMVQCK